MTRRECDRQRQKLGYSRLYVGNYQTKGCFSKGDVAYFGRGGNGDDKSKPELLGEQKRIWCTAAATPIQTTTSHDPREKCIDVRVNTGKLYGEKAGFELSTKPRDGSGPKKLLDYPAGSLDSEKEYKKKICVPEGTYTLTAIGKGSHSALVEDEEILFGYNSWGKTNSYDIVVGYDPPMDDYKKAWLDEHNERREAFHENNGKKYRPLRWSSELARDASAWVDEILPTCKIVREPGLEEGENIAIHRYSENQGPSDNETPSTILARWSDAKLGKDYPDNQTMTQVMWRASRYVGCASKSVMNAEDGAYCYVSICRYSRPGNCSMLSGNWLDVTLRDHSRCGKACPGEGCH